MRGIFSQLSGASERVKCAADEVHDVELLVWIAAHCLSRGYAVYKRLRRLTVPWIYRYYLAICPGKSKSGRHE